MQSRTSRRRFLGSAVAACKYVPENLGSILFSKGGDVVVKDVQGWKMRSIHAAR